ncbi:MAG: hypothetical protein OXP71_01435 [Candidatus Poribacteria bacterium]|nr:hypothetical protein [Candidatus Poribacteria bacterium]
MKTAVSILTLAFVWITVFIQRVESHISNPNINAKARVYTVAAGNDVVNFIAKSSCTFTIGGHAGGSDDNHQHKANWFAQVYIHDIGGNPDPNVTYAVRNPTRDIWGSGFWKPNSSPLSVGKTLAVGECAEGDAISSGRLWTPQQNDDVYGRDEDNDNHLSYCNWGTGAAPRLFRAQIQELDFEELGEVMLDLIETARLVNSDIDAAVYFDGHIQTLVFNENTVYVYGSYSLGVPELVEENLTGDLRAAANIVELDLSDGVEYEIPAAPPKYQRRLTTSWADMKQK